METLGGTFSDCARGQNYFRCVVHLCFLTPRISQEISLVQVQHSHFKPSFPTSAVSRQVALQPFSSSASFKALPVSAKFLQGPRFRGLRKGVGTRNERSIYTIIFCWRKSPAFMDFYGITGVVYGSRLFHYKSHQPSPKMGGVNIPTIRTSRTRSQATPQGGGHLTSDFTLPKMVVNIYTLEAPRTPTVQTAGLRVRKISMIFRSAQ